MPEPPDLEVLGLSASERIVIEHALHNSNTCLCGLDNLSAVGCVRKDNSHERRCRQRRLDGSLWCYCCRADRRRIGAYMHPPDASNWYGPCGCPYPDCCDSTGWVCYGRLGRYPTLFSDAACDIQRFVRRGAHTTRGPRAACSRPRAGGCRGKMSRRPLMSSWYPTLGTGL